MKKHFYQFIFFRLMGWKITGSIQPETKKCILMVVPHTSWHDFYLGLFTRGITRLDMHYIAKKELFKWPFGVFFRYMGGTPIDRKGSSNKVDAIAKIFEEREIFRLAVLPEGTRKKVSEIKTGFYYIALKANVPIIPVAFDFENKQVKIGEPLAPSGHIDVDLPLLLHHFKNVKGKIAKNSFEVV